ncbi:hypothetical protein G7054_g5369 [Neopestalotiopsis clavispora]|nr:hypothetical protein G7054_g5369 [Neopestalotiopsis clavispora]
MNRGGISFATLHLSRFGMLTHNDWARMLNHQKAVLTPRVYRSSGSPVTNLKMAVLYVRATYADEENLKDFLKSVFGWGKTGIEWTRGRWECTIPRALKPVDMSRDLLEKRFYSQWFRMK